MKTASTAPTSAAATAPALDDSEIRKGTLYGFLAYSMWGVLPLYFHILSPASAQAILAHRITWSLVFCILLGIATRNFAWVRPLLRNPRHIAVMAVAALLLTVNWGVYIYAVTTGNVVESSLGYFINPLILVLMGVLILKERLRQLQWIAVALGTIAVLIISIDYGRPPWIALALATSFATYGYIKKLIGTQNDALATMTVETAVLAPFSAIALIWIETSSSGTFTSEGPGHTLLLLSTGVITAVPLILFAAAARRVPLVTMGMLQFIAPVLQFICGVAILGEEVPLSRWIGFGFVWAALVVLTTDTVRNTRRRRTPVAGTA